MLMALQDGRCPGSELATRHFMAYAPRFPAPNDDETSSSRHCYTGNRHWAINHSMRGPTSCGSHSPRPRARSLRLPRLSVERDRRCLVPKSCTSSGRAVHQVAVSSSLCVCYLDDVARGVQL